MIQTLVNRDVAPMGIMQLMRQQKTSKYHLNYSTTEKKTKKQPNISHTELNSAGETSSQSDSSFAEKRKQKCDEFTCPTFRPTLSRQSKQVAQQPLCLFSGCFYKRRFQ